MATFADLQCEKQQNAGLTVKIRTYNAVKLKTLVLPVDNDRRVPVNGAKIRQFDPPTILPPPTPQLAQIPELNTYWGNVDADQLLGTHLFEDQTNAEHEIHLPLKKRRISALKVVNEHEFSYPSTPMINIAELEDLKSAQRNNRPFKTPAELKEVPPLPPTYLLTVPHHVVTDNLNINPTFNKPTINYVSRHFGELSVPQSGKGCLPTGKVTVTSTDKKRNSRTIERKSTKAKS